MTQTTILIVEDDSLSRELAQTICETAGYTVLSVEDGVGLLERVKAERPDLILMDLQLPHIDGLTLVRQLKADDETRQIPVVMATAYAPSEVRAKALKAGCTAFLAKPFDARTLLQTVAGALTRREGCHDDA